MDCALSCRAGCSPPTPAAVFVAVVAPGVSAAGHTDRSAAAPNPISVRPLPDRHRGAGDALDSIFFFMLSLSLSPRWE